MGADAAPAAIELEKAVKDDDAEVRKHASQALENLDAVAIEKAKKTREAVVALANGLKASEPEERVKTLYKIAAFERNGDAVGEQVIEAMQDKIGAVRTAASETLSRINPKVHPHVVAILREKNKREAIQALGELGDGAVIAVPLLLHCNDDVFFWGGGKPKAGQFYEDLFPVIAKIAPADRRFSAAVLSYVSTTNSRRDGMLRQRRISAHPRLTPPSRRRAEKLPQPFSLVPQRGCSSRPTASRC
jgi:HEAT repeat protein